MNSGVVSAGGAEDSRVARSVRDAAKLRERDELARLLYVGLTRARDRLILCGRLKAKGTVDKARGWLPWLADAFDVRLADQVRTLIDDQGFAFQRFGPDPARGATRPAEAAEAPPPPAWPATLRWPTRTSRISRRAYTSIK